MYMSVEMSFTAARAELGPVTNRVEYGGETVYLTKHGRRTTAIVPAAAAELLEQIEDLLDGQAVQNALEALHNGTEEAIPFVRRTRRAS